MSVVASFKKIKALVQSSSMLASALRTSSKLVSSMIILLYNVARSQNGLLLFLKLFHSSTGYFISHKNMTNRSTSTTASLSFPCMLLMTAVTFMIVWLYMQVVSEDGNRVKRVQPFTESDLEELQVIMRSLYITCNNHML